MKAVLTCIELSKANLYFILIPYSPTRLERFNAPLDTYLAIFVFLPQCAKKYPNFDEQVPQALSLVRYFLRNKGD